MLTERSTIQYESSNRHTQITFPKAGEHPEEIIREEILRLLTVAKVATSN